MKLIKRIIGFTSIALVAVFAGLYLATLQTPTSAVAVKLFYPENVTDADATVIIAMWIAFASTLASGILSVLMADTRKGEVLMVVLDAIGFLVGLMYSLIIPCLLVISVLDIIALMFSVSYSQLDNDYNGTI